MLNYYFPPAYSYLAADKMIKIWSVFTGQIVRTLLGHTEGLSDIAWSGDSKYLASASDDKTIRIWDVDHVRRTSPIPTVAANE